MPESYVITHYYIASDCWSTDSSEKCKQLYVTWAYSEAYTYMWFSSCRTQHTQRNRCTACDAMKKPKYAMHTHEKCNGHKDRIGCILLQLHISFFIASRASFALHCLWVGLCDIQLFTFLWWVSGSAVRRNVIMSNYMMSNYVTLWRQRPVCQFSWCPVPVQGRGRACSAP